MVNSRSHGHHASKALGILEGSPDLGWGNREFERSPVVDDRSWWAHDGHAKSWIRFARASVLPADDRSRPGPCAK